jgi:hypothetical protein
MFPPFALLPLLVLAAGFEVVFATHVGVERIGRYLQVRYEGDGTVPPSWEHAAMAIGPRASIGSGIDPLFVWLFVVATLLNFIPVAVRTAFGGTSFIGVMAAVLAACTIPHVLFIWRVYSARQFAANQRSRDLELFKQTS